MNISEAFEEICEKFQLHHKLDYIITDNAANMKRAFTVCFPSDNDVEGEAYDDDLLDDISIWQDINQAELSAVDNIIDRSGKKARLQCFCHTLQLVVGDAMKETKPIRSVLAKCSKISSQLHTVCGLKEAFEEAFGGRTSIPADVCTRWNSTFRQISAIIKLGVVKLNQLLRTKWGNLEFTANEWSKLIDLATILHPFSQATDVTQGEKVVTSSCVLPSILALYQHCLTQVECSRHLKQMAASLRDSLMKRFKGNSLLYSRF